MSQDWYLTRPVQYESEGLGHNTVSDWHDSLDIVLASGIRDNVIVYNSDLTESKNLTCVMVNKSANTYLQTHQRQMLCHVGDIKAGMYIFDGHNYWLTIGLPDDVYGVYEKIVCLLCEYKMKWQNDDGDIIERWCVATSASKYNIGQNVGNYYTTTSNNFTLIFAEDAEVDKLYDKRVFLANYDRSRKVYRIARDDDILYQYGIKGSCCSFIAGKDEFNAKTDNDDLELCDYFEPPKTDGDFSYVIVGENKLQVSIYNEYSYLCYEDGVLIDKNLEWEVNAVGLSITYHDEIIDDIHMLFVSANSTKDIGKKFTVKIMLDGEVVSTKTITITSFV